MTCPMVDEIIKAQQERHAWLNSPEVTAWCEQKRKEREEDDTEN